MAIKKSKRRSVYNQRAVERSQVVWERWCLGESIASIARGLRICDATAKSDIDRVRATLEAANLDQLDDRRRDAVQARRGIMEMALKDRAVADPQHRAPLLREAERNQTGIENLNGLLAKEEAAPSAQAGVFLVQVGDQAPKAIEDLSDAELERMVAVPEEDLEKLAEGEGE